MINPLRPPAAECMNIVGILATLRAIVPGQYADSIVPKARPMTNPQNRAEFSSEERGGFHLFTRRIMIRMARAFRSSSTIGATTTVSSSPLNGRMVSMMIEARSTRKTMLMDRMTFSIHIYFLVTFILHLMLLELHFPRIEHLPINGIHLILASFAGQCRLVILSRSGG